MAAKKRIRRRAGSGTKSARERKRGASRGHLGELEIVFTGLCSFLNLANTNGTMPPPSVILPRTPLDENPHTPFIAYNATDVTVKTEGGGAPFEQVKKAPEFYWRQLDGVLIELREDSVGWPVILPSYALLARKDCYWPEAQNRWDRRYVPEGNAQPDELVVAAYMRLGGGTVGAERLTDFEWEFRYADDRCTQRAYFAQEVIYRIYPFRSEKLTLTLRRMDKRPLEEKFTFTLVRNKKLKIWIGNSDQLHKSLLRLSSVPKRAIHFKYLNDVADVPGSGPIPYPLIPYRLFNPEDAENERNENTDAGPGAGSDTGYCGPQNPGG